MRRSSCCLLVPRRVVSSHQSRRGARRGRRGPRNSKFVAVSASRRRASLPLPLPLRGARNFQRKARAVRTPARYGPPLSPPGGPLPRKAIRFNSRRRALFILPSFFSPLSVLRAWEKVTSASESHCAPRFGVVGATRRRQATLPVGSATLEAGASGCRFDAAGANGCQRLPTAGRAEKNNGRKGDARPAPP